MGHRTFPLFLLAGGMAAFGNMVTRYYLDLVLPYVPSIIIAYLLGMIIAFSLNRQFVFRSSNNALWQQISWFVAINLVALAQTLALSIVLSRWILPWIGWNFALETTAHVIGVAFPVLTSYIGHQRLTFRA